MQAVLHVALQCEFLVPEGAEFNLYTYADSGYEVTAGPPVRSGRDNLQDRPDHVELGGTPAFLADTLHIRFGRESFDRVENGDVDPPLDVLNRAIDSLISRLKFVTQSWLLRPPRIQESEWHLRYLNDDGTELPIEKGLVRGRGTTKFSFACVPCTPQIWDSAHTLLPDFSAPPWHTLLVDSKGALPHVGSAIVLCAAALEVFIADVLARLAPSSSIPPALWDWIHERGDWQKEPSVEEQFSVLLQVLSGHSLKDDNSLWESFKRIRRARNAFVHEGAPKIGRAVLTVAEANTLIEHAHRIVQTVREWLPEDLRWPTFQHEVQIQIQKGIGGKLAAPTGSTGAGAA